MSVNKTVLKEMSLEEKETLLNDNKLFLEKGLNNHFNENDYLKYFLTEDNLKEVNSSNVGEFLNKQLEGNNKLFLTFGKVLEKDLTLYGLDHLFSDISLFKSFVINYLEHLKKHNVLFIGVFYFSDEDKTKYEELLKTFDLDIILTNSLDKRDTKGLMFNALENNYKLIINDEIDLMIDKTTNLKDKLATFESDNLNEDSLDTKESLKLEEEIIEENEEIIEDETEDSSYQDSLFEETEDQDIEIVEKLVEKEVMPKKTVVKKTKKKKVRKGVSLPLKLLVYLVMLVIVNLIFILILISVRNGSFDPLIILMMVISNYVTIRTVNHLLKTEYVKPRQTKISLVLNEMPYLKPVSVNVFEEIEESDEVLEENIEEVIEKEIYHEVNDLNKYLIDLNDYLKANGVIISLKALRIIFSNLMAERINVINSNDQLLTNKAYELIAEYMGANITNLEVNNNMTEIDYLNNERSKLSQAIKIANMSKDKVNFIVLSELNYSKFNDNFKNVIQHAKSPNVKKYIEIQTGKMRIPRNLWFILLPNKDTNNVLEKELKNSATHLNLLINEFEIDENYEDLDNLRLSFYNLNDLIRDNREDYYLEEDTWKKFDRLISYLKANNIDVFNNYIVQAIENYTAMYLLSGGDSSELVDDLLANKVLSIITGHKINGSFDNDLSFVDFVEDLFQNDNLSNSKIVLNKIQELSNLEEE